MAIPYAIAMIFLLLFVGALIAAVFSLVFSEQKPRGRKLALAAALFCFVGLALYAAMVEPISLHTTRTSVDLQPLSTPLKVVLLSDIHAATVQKKYLDDVVDAVNAEKPDIVLLDGDFISYGDAEMYKLDSLGRLQAKGGVYAVLGNHDYGRSRSADCDYPDGDALGARVAAKLESLGVKVLENQRADAGDVVLYGLGDEWGCRADYAGLARKRARAGDSGRPAILFAHNQEAIPPEAFADWDFVLMGHTHCGQVRLPLVGSIPERLGFRGEYDMGYYQYDYNSFGYTTCGIGGGPPRFLAVPEVSVLYLS